MAQALVVAAVEAQEVDAGLGGDALAPAVLVDERPRREQRQLVGGGDVQPVQARAVGARPFQRQLRRLDAGLARADVGLAGGGNVVAVFAARTSPPPLDPPAAFAWR